MLLSNWKIKIGPSSLFKRSLHLINLYYKFRSVEIFGYMISFFIVIKLWFKIVLPVVRQWLAMFDLSGYYIWCVQYFLNVILNLRLICLMYNVSQFLQSIWYTFELVFFFIVVLRWFENPILYCLFLGNIVYLKFISMAAKWAK